MLAVSKAQPRSISSTHCSGITSHVARLDLHRHNMIAEVIAMGARSDHEEESCKEMDEMSLEQTKLMMVAVENEYKFQRDHLACEELAFAGNRKHGQWKPISILGAHPDVVFGK